MNTSRTARLSVCRAVVAAFLCAAAPACAQDDPAKRIDTLLQEWSRPDAPGVSVAVIRDGRVVFRKGYGSANLEYGVPVTPETVYHVASVSKQFAMAIVLLETDGKLSLEDDVRKYLRELPDYGHKITIRNLLQHTSGIRDQWQTLSLAGWRMDDVITQDQILRMLFRQRELNFTPGAEHLYSNGGYTLAAEIVKRVSGKPFGDFCEERIFRPLGMSDTHFHQDHKRIVRNRAYSYNRSGTGFEISPLNYANVGATSLFTTAPDLIKWLDNFRQAKVGGAGALARLQEQAVLADGRRIPYALGIAVAPVRGIKTLSHSGGDAGYRSHVVWFPEAALGVAVLSGAAHCNPGRIAVQVAEVFLGSRFAPEPAKPKVTVRKEVKIEPDESRKFIGLYRLEAGIHLVIDYVGGALRSAIPGQPASAMMPVGGRRFYVPAADAELDFTPYGNGQMRVRLVQGSNDLKGERVEALPFDPAELAKYAGAYWSDELETQYTLTVRDGKLLAGHPRHLEITLEPVVRDFFLGRAFFFGEVRFERGASGSIDGMTVGGGRVRGVKFRKQ